METSNVKFLPAFPLESPRWVPPTPLPARPRKSPVRKVSATEHSSSGVLRSQVLSALVHSPRDQADSSGRPRGERRGKAAVLTWDAPPARLRREVWGQVQPQARRRRRWEGPRAGPGPALASGGWAGAKGRGVGPASPPPGLSWKVLSRLLSHWPQPAPGSFLWARVGQPLNHRDITSIQALIRPPQLQVCAKRFTL